jgi:protein-tyrosine kinase
MKRRLNRTTYEDLIMIPLPVDCPQLEDIYIQTLGAKVSTLAITAAQSGEGVSTLAYALARRAAADARKTLLVDFNRGRPSVGPRLAIASRQWSPGDPSALQMIEPLSNIGLSILPAPIGDAVELRSRDTEALHDCFKKWRREFDCIIADTSPLTVRSPENFPPENVCAACDGTVLLVLTGQTSEIKVLEARDRLKTTNAHLIGAVLNDQYAPSLADELVRETWRLNNVVPGMMKMARSTIRRSNFINQAI